MRLRSIIALALLVGYATSSAEVVLGELRDGAVHHESVASALDHTQLAQGEHGHEDPGQQEPEHGPEHEHGTSADHCTHTHSANLPGDPIHFRTVAQVASVPSQPPTAQIEALPGELYHPPQA